MINKVQSKYKNNTRPAIIMTKYSTNRYNIRSLSSNLKSVYDVVNFSNAWIHNAVIDQCSLEFFALSKNLDQALSIIRSSTIKVKGAITIDGAIVDMKGKTSSVTRVLNTQKGKIKSKSLDDEIKLLTDECKSSKQELEILHNTVKDIDKQYKAIIKEENMYKNAKKIRSTN